MIFITPKTINRPAETMNRIAAVVTTSSPRFSIVAAPRCGLLQGRTLRARIDVLERLEHLHRPVRLYLTEVHRERRMTLLAHLDGAARTVERDLREGRNHLGGFDAAGLFDRGLVQ